MKKLVPSLLEYLKITEESNTDNENYNNVISPLAYSKMIKLGTEPIDPNGIFEYVVFLVRDKYNPRYPNDKLNWKFCIGGRRIAHKDVGNNWYLIGQELCLDNLNSKRIQDKIIFKKYTKYEFNKSFKEWYVTHQKYYFIDSNSEGTEEERIDTDCRQSGYKPEKRGANIKFVPDTSKESEIIISNMLEILKEANNIVLEFGSNPDSLFHSDKKINMQDIVKHRKGIDFGNEFEEKESSDIQKIISNSKRKKDYSKMSQKELEKEMNKAIDLNDLNTLKQIQPYLSESLKIFLKYDIRARCIYENIRFERGKDPKTAMGIGNKDAQLIEKLRNLGYTFHWKEVPISIVIEDNDDVEELFQWENNIGEQLILYKLDLEHRTFYELQLRHKFDTPGHTEYFQNKDIMDPDKVWYYHNRFNESINFERGQDPYAALDIGRDRMKRKLISAAKEYAHENIPMHYLPTEKQYDDFANHTLKIIASGFNPEYIFDDIEGWFDEWREDQGITETQHFERGLEPKSAIGVGHAHLYPEKELFKRIYSYWEKVPETGWPYDFEELTPIRWTSPQPSFKVLVKSLQGEDGSGYTFYLTKEGVVAFWGHYVDAGGGRRSWRDEEYTIKDFKHFIRILESNHVQHMKLGESQNFERGKEPYKALDIGKYRTVKKGDKILVFYKGEVMKATALDDEDVDTKAERNFIDFEDEEGDRCWAVRSTTDPNVWLVPSANESFQKGKDVKEAIRIGTYSKLWAELEEMNGPDGFEFNEDFFHIIDNDYDTNNPAILTKLYKLLDMGKIFKSNVGEKSDHTEVILHQTPAGPIFSWDFDYGTGYAAPIEWWPKIEKTLLEIPVSRVEVMKQDGWNPEDPEEVKEFEEETLSNPKISNLIS